MSQQTSVYAWIVFFISAGAYVPLAVGGWYHPSEINMAAYGIWMVLAGMFLYSSWKQEFAGVRMPLGFFVGNVLMLVFGFWVGGYTFNLGPAETMALYGVVGTLSLWTTIGALTSRWSSRLLYWGAIVADLLSFYPQWKQYLLPHDYPTTWMLVGWCCWIGGAAINVVFVEKLFKKLLMPEEEYEREYEKMKKPLLIWEESAFSLENCFFMTVTVFLMAR